MQRMLVFPTPRPAETTSVTLSILDATVARFSATGAIWIFDAPPTNKPVESLIEQLQLSFTTTLAAFPHWAGTLRFTPVRAGGNHQERFNRPMIVYGNNSDPGVEWVVVEQAYNVVSLVPTTAERKARHGIWKATDFPQKDLLSSTPLALHNLSDFEGLPCMSVQLNTFTCGGYAVAVKMAHPLADAQALMVFMHQWAASSRVLDGHPAKSLMDGPIFNPSLLDSHATGDIDAQAADPEIIASARSLPMHRFDWWQTSVPGYLDLFKATTEASKPPAEELSALVLSPSVPAPWHTWDVLAPVEHSQLHFDKEELVRMQSSARAASKGRPDLSRMDVLLAHIWALINRAKGNAESSDDVFLNVTLGARTRVSPPLSASFIGSPLFLTHVCASGSAASNTSIGAIATAIRETISLFTPEKMGAILHDAAYEISPQRLWQAFLGKQHTLVTSWMHLRVYDIVFEGQGQQPRYVQAVMPKMDGCVQIMDSGGAVGGLDVSLYLEKEAMGRLVEDVALRSFM